MTAYVIEHDMVDNYVRGDVIDILDCFHRDIERLLRLSAIRPATAHEAKDALGYGVSPFVHLPPPRKVSPQALYARRIRQERLDAGLCVYCGKEPPEPGKKTGRACFEKYRLAKTEYRICAICGQWYHSVRQRRPCPHNDRDFTDPWIRARDRLKGMLPLSSHTANALVLTGVKTLDDLLEMTPEELAAIRNIGEGALRQIIAAVSLPEKKRPGTAAFLERMQRFEHDLPALIKRQRWRY